MILKIFIAVAAVIVVAPAIAGVFLMQHFIKRYDIKNDSLSLRCEDIEGIVSLRHCSFMSGKNKLHGYIFCEENTKGLIIFCHGMFGGAAEYFPFALHFAQKGYAVFMYDNTGCHMSEGKNINGALQGLFDLNAAIDFINSDAVLKDKKRVLMGHSWGGFTCCACKNTENVKAVVSLAGFNQASPAICDMLAGLYGNFLHVVKPYCDVMMFFKYGKTAFTSSVKNINSSRTPYLIIHGSHDRIIHLNGSSIYNKKEKITNKNAEFILITDENHNRHDTIFRDNQAATYLKERLKLIRCAKQSLSGKAQEQKTEKIVSETNRFFANKLNSAIMQSIDSFIEKHIGET